MDDIWCEVYRAANVLEAHSLKGMLESSRIPVRLQGESLSAAAGELPADVLEVGIWVPQSCLIPAARLLSAYEQAEPPGWCCPRCGEQNGAQFELCWQCGHDRDA